MEGLKPLAARALGINQETVRVPYDLLSVINLDSLWTAVGNDVSVNAGIEVISDAL